MARQEASLASGSKASKGRSASRGCSFRDELKRDEPQDRQRDAIGPRGRRGGNRRGGEKPRGRNADGAGRLIPKARRRRRAGSGLPGSADGGAFFGNPQERKPGSNAGRHGPGSRRARRHQGHEGRASSSSTTSERPGRRTLEGHASRVRGSLRSRRAVVRAIQPRRRPDIPFPAEALRGARGEARTSLAALVPSSEGPPTRERGRERDAPPAPSLRRRRAPRRVKGRLDRKVGSSLKTRRTPYPASPRPRARGRPVRCPTL